MCVDIECLVDQVKSVLLLVVAENVLLFAAVAQFHDPAFDEVVDVAAVVDEHEALVADPLA